MEDAVNLVMTFRVKAGEPDRTENRKFVYLMKKPTFTEWFLGKQREVVITMDITTGMEK